MSPDFPLFQKFRLKLLLRSQYCSHRYHALTCPTTKFSSSCVLLFCPWSQPRQSLKNFFYLWLGFSHAAALIELELSICNVIYEIDRTPRQSNSTSCTHYVQHILNAHVWSWSCCRWNSLDFVQNQKSCFHLYSILCFALQLMEQSGHYWHTVCMTARRGQFHCVRIGG